MITITGLLCIPIGLATMFLSWRAMLMTAMIFSTMSAAAVAMVGSFGLAPGYYMILLIMARIALGIATHGLTAPREIAPALACLGLFLLASVFSLWAAVTFFQGKVVVLGGGDNFQLTLAAPYQFRRENITQLSYLFLSVTLAALLGIKLVRMQPPALLRIIDQAMIGCIIFCHVLCLWQWLSYSVHWIVWPHDFFFSNTNYAPREDQILFDSVRLSGPFSEPSSLGVAYAGFFAYLLRRYREDGSIQSMLLLMMTVLIMLLSKSTTAYAMLALIGAVAAFQPLALAASGRLRSPRVSAAGLLAIVLAFGAILGMVWYATENKDFVSNLLDELIFKKQEGSSYRERSGSNLMALQILVDTSGVGIGIGSHKPSSLLLTLLSNTGILGTVAFGAMLYLLLRLPPRGPAWLGEVANGAPLRWWVVATLLTLIFSGPNLSNAALWIGLGLQLSLTGSLAISRHMAPIAVGFLRPSSAHRRNPDLARP